MNTQEKSTWLQSIGCHIFTEINGLKVTFTPGPLVANGCGIYEQKPPGRSIACTGTGMATTLTEDAANAKLYAAAPDLLAALESLTHCVERNRIRYSSGRMMPEADKKIYIDECRAAIAKAKGQQ